MSDFRKAVLLIGFGGPTEAIEVRPFLESVLQGVRIPEERFNEVLHHYEVVGNYSPYNEITFRQRKVLEDWFQKKGESYLVAVGLRHCRPTFTDAFKVFNRYSVEQVYGFVLSNFRCYSSFEKYTEKVEESRLSFGENLPPVNYLPNFYENSLFIRAQVKRVRQVLEKIPSDERQSTYFIFSSHSIPVEMARKSGYDKQYEKTASLIVKELGITEWGMGYQSRSGSPRDPWLAPDVKSLMESLDKKKFKNVLLVPVGFLCDNVEVIFDLDVEAKETAQSLGFGYFRASTVMDDPDFIEMIGQMVLEADHG